jgi:hypothetical protein
MARPPRKKSAVQDRVLKRARQELLTDISVLLVLDCGVTPTRLSRRAPVSVARLELLVAKRIV